MYKSHWVAVRGLWKAIAGSAYKRFIDDSRHAVPNPATARNQSGEERLQLVEPKAAIADASYGSAGRSNERYPGGNVPLVLGEEGPGCICQSSGDESQFVSHRAGWPD